MFSDILLTADFDRTLTARDSSVPARNIEAIHYFMDHGGTFTVNTGRSVPMFRRFMNMIPANAPFLLYNGSAAYGENGLTLQRPIALDMVRTMADLLEKFPDMNLEVQGVEAHYNFKKNPSWDRFCEFNGCRYKTVKLGEDIGEFLKFSLCGTLRDGTVAELFSGTQEELVRIEQVSDYIQERYGDVVEIFRAAPRILDIHAKGVSKIRAARDLQAKLGKKILVCVGDAENDIPMLDGADFAYCPSDGVVAARYENVCSCDEGAVADVIYKKIPEILAKMA